jgi:hypothetical protein
VSDLGFKVKQGSIKVREIIVLHATDDVVALFVDTWPTVKTWKFGQNESEFVGEVTLTLGRERDTEIVVKGLDPECDWWFVAEERADSFYVVLVRDHGGRLDFSDYHWSEED